MITKDDVTQEIKDAVCNVLLAQAWLDTVRPKVEEVYAGLLKKYALYTDLEPELERITESKLMFLSRDDNTCKVIYYEAGEKLESMGLRPSSWEKGICPKCVAERKLTDRQHVLVRLGAKMLDTECEDLHNKLMCAGMDKWHEFIDLMIGLVVNLPDFKKPPLPSNEQMNTLD